jgi:peroxiredoxin
MPDQTTAYLSVQQSLDALQAERNATWDTQVLLEHAALRRSLEENADRNRFIKVGDVVQQFSLPEVDGGQVVLTKLLETGPVVLVFFRFEGCPACNAAWSAYKESLAPAIRELGAQLVAISPQAPEKLIAIKQRQPLDFLVASDPSASLLRAFGIAFAPTVEVREQMIREGKDIGEILGTGKWDLPYPTVIVIGQDRVVRFADVHPDWMIRTESQSVIDAVRALSTE